MPLGLGSSGAGFVQVEVAETALVSETITGFAAAIACVAGTIHEAQWVFLMAEMLNLQSSSPLFLLHHSAISNRLAKNNKIDLPRVEVNKKYISY